MNIVMTLSNNQVIDLLIKQGFSYEGSGLILNTIHNYDSDQYELDPIALRCGVSELTLDNFKNDFSHENDLIQDLENNIDDIDYQVELVENYLNENTFLYGSYYDNCGIPCFVFDSF